MIINRSLLFCLKAPRKIGLTQSLVSSVLNVAGALRKDLDDFVAVPYVLDSSSWFYIARFPVTNIQYQRFIMSPDFGKKEYWTEFPKYNDPSLGCQRRDETTGDEGWEWIQRTMVGGERVVKDGVVYPKFWSDPFFGISRRYVPVVGVTWWEANAYCKWLNTRLPKYILSRLDVKGFYVRLPTETEWVAAAGGETPRGRFPWDKPDQVILNPRTSQKNLLRFIADRINVLQSGIGKTSEVWLYPLGRSVHGVAEMGGNVWEWQANQYGENNASPASRGGSWKYDYDSARISTRDFVEAGSSWDDDGFRIVLTRDDR